MEGELGLYVATDLGVDVIGATPPDLPGRLARTPPSACASSPAGRGWDSTWAAPRSPRRPALNERAVSFTKGCYVGQETVARLHYKGKPNRHLRGLRLTEPAAHGDPILLGEKQVGTVGSTCVSPAHGPIALALVRREAAPGDEVDGERVAGDGRRAAVRAA